MPSVTVRIPDSLRVSGYIPDPINLNAKARLAAILTRENIEPAAAPMREVSVHANFWLNAADASRLSELGRSRDMSVGEVITVLLVQDAQMQRREATPAPVCSTCPAELRAALDALDLREREDQTRFYQSIAKVASPDSPCNGKVLFAEAGTGTGKTLAYLVAAHRMASQDRAALVGIAVPTHTLMDKVLRDWAGLVDALDSPIGNTVPLLGQAEFVSVTALATILPEIEDPEIKAAVEQWIAKGGPGPEDGIIRHRWTIAGLHRAAPAFRLMRTVTLEHRENDDDPGFLSYKGQWASLAQATVVFMTHAMLASLTWRHALAQGRALKDSAAVQEAIAAWEAVPRESREKRLYEVLDALYASTDDAAGQAIIPRLALLVVDEAHQLDDAFALVLSRTVSMWALRRDLQALHAAHPRIVKRSDVEALETLWQRMRKVGDPDTLLPEDECLELATSLSVILDATTKRKRPRDTHADKWRRLSLIAFSLRMALKAKSSSTAGLIEVVVRWSPDRLWPQMLIGRTSYAREMHHLWTVLAHRSCLVSGTLYEELPQLNCESTRRALNVPFDNMLTMEPVHAAWQYAPVTVCMAGPIFTAGGRPRYVRPRASGETSELSSSAANSHTDWARDVATYSGMAHQEGAGGMLILGTAFRDLQVIAELLREATRTPVLEHRAGESLAALREQFLTLAEEGSRPILLAAGGAWTGFDLHSEKARNACTDLVILNAPFGAISRNLAREVRLRQRRGFNDLTSMVTVLVRQGIGRLVRSPDTPHNRRIHWLDAKIHQPGMAGLLNPVKRVFAKYRQITVG